MGFGCFKQLNDTHGHQAGNQALRLFAAEALELVRKADVSARNWL
jgi:diguanylate cyclase (GGDEF)-like protein